MKNEQWDSMSSGAYERLREKVELSAKRFQEASRGTKFVEVDQVAREHLLTCDQVLQIADDSECLIVNVGLGGPYGYCEFSSKEDFTLEFTGRKDRNSPLRETVVQ